MKHKNDTARQQDRELSRRFRQLREHDTHGVPEFPSQETLAKRAPIMASSRLYPTLQKIAVAAAVVVVVGVMMTRPMQQDPGDLYAEIMSANSIATDQLMLVSYSAAPEMTSMPSIYEIDLPLGPEEITN